jgi:hypothetical protein
MAQIDHLKLRRNTATLDAYRQHQRAIRAAEQPWLTIALIAGLLGIGLIVYDLFHNSLFRNGPLLSLLAIVGGLAGAMAGIRARRYSESHPFEPPEPPSAPREDRKLP